MLNTACLAQRFKQNRVIHLVQRSRLEATVDDGIADPVGSVFTNYFKTGELGQQGKFLVEGVGKGNIPGAMDMSLIDDVFPVSDAEAFEMCFRLAREEGLCVGGSSGRMRRIQTGFVRSYALSMLVGAVLLVGALLLVKI